MNIIRLFCLLVCLFTLMCPAKMHAQQVIKGMIKDEQGKPVVAANVILQLNENTTIITFGITGENGEFTLKIPSNLDSVWIIVTHLSYAAQKNYIQTATPYHEITLPAQVYKLPELVVKNDPFMQRGDTLIFDVSRYRQNSDQNIEQVLSRIPGITIEGNGRIQYNGLDISKFYIEGLDMLEGRYRIATRNLRIDAIRDIEIIERHQPIRALDSLLRPDNAAINLRLKSNIAVTGSLRGGAGASPLLYLGAADIFGFTKKQQFNILGSANNIGEDQGNNFQNLYINFNDLTFDLIQINKAIPPLLVKEQYYLDNQELTGGYNYLRKIATYTELKWQGFARRDRILNIGNRLLRWNDGSNEVQFDEILNAVERPLVWNNRLILEHNATKVFFRADVNADWNMIKSNANNQVNDVLFPEELNKNDLKSAAELTTIIRRNNKAYQINSNITYQTTDYNLVLMPVDIFTPDFPPTRLNEAAQMVKNSRFKTDTYSNLFFKIKDIRGQVNFGAIYHYTTLNSDIITNNSSGTYESLGSAFQNQNIFSEWLPYFNQVYKKEKNNNTWTLRLPLSASLLRLNNEINNDQSSFNLLIINPKIEYQLKTPANNYWSASYAFQQDFDRFDNLFYEGYIIRANRNIATSLFDINRFNKQELNGGFFGRGVGKISEYNIGASLFEMQYDFINNNNFNQLGVVNNFIRNDNRVRGTGLQSNIAGIISNHMRFNVRTSYRFSQRPSIINGERLSIQNHFFYTRTQIDYTFAQSIISLRPAFQLFSNNFFDEPGYQLNTELIYFIKVNTNSSIRAAYHQYFTAVAARQVWNGLFACEYRHTLPKLKADIFLNISNIFNNPYYITIAQNAFDETISYYRWRPRQAVFSFNKKL
ncbi:MAG TPA: carboxypeptidase-like regulatory domain-containing protein [Saprospiraceae bacterium]|nr:carboxypeptidase-like regulatory domain-containing protein [Saprospiraceae bacterium]HMP15021.1 carboxypeptidase-like regulatory domain-containing protein [Saprospiraceae bacterium]